MNFRDNFYIKKRILLGKVSSPRFCTWKCTFDVYTRYVQGVYEVCTRCVWGENVLTRCERGVQNCTKWSRSRLIGRGVINALCLTGFFMDLIQKVNVYNIIFVSKSEENIRVASGIPKWLQTMQKCHLGWK